MRNALSQMNMQPSNALERVYGYDVRKPYLSEDTYFSGNRHVAGMAAEDGRIVLNPYSALNIDERNAVARNEAARLYMRERNITPLFDVRPDQAAFFKGSAYENNPAAMRQTILARRISGDPSAGAPTEEQALWAAWMRRELENR